uniref:Transcription elongation factor A N-terminal and central domain containing n=1 Tax=Oncorhynchus kisutch TaxID=8019 RepID=A0A8C7GBN5_ONCKI
MDTKQITHHALQMDKFNREGNYGNIMPLLTALDNDCVTCEQLQGTDIVRVLYRLLNTCSDHSVRRTAKHLLSKWKKLYSYPYHISKQKGSREEFTVVGEMELGASSGDLSSESILPTLSKQSETPATTSLGNPSPCKDSYELALRTKCIQLLLGALNPETSKEAEGRRTDMANKELQRLREEYSSRGVSEMQLPQDLEGTPTQKLRCEGSDCRVTRVSRGKLFLLAWFRQATADQDAMTFVTCSRCGEQWYHSGWVCL